MSENVEFVKKFTFKIDVYATTVEVIVVQDEYKTSDYTRELFIKKKCDPSEIPAKVCGYTLNFPDNLRKYYIVLCLKYLDVNTITHESDHLRNYILEYQSIKETENKEASANLNGFINQKIFHYLHKYNLPIKY